MVQFINQPQSRSALLGQALGSGLGSGLSMGIGSLLENKLAQLQQQQQSHRAQQFGLAAGMSPEQARAFSYLGPKERERIGAELFLGSQIGGNQQQAQQNYGNQQQSSDGIVFL